MNLRRLIIIIFIFVINLKAQGLNDWQTITYMNDITDLIHVDGKIWVSTTGGAYEFNPQDSTYIAYDNLDGLGSLKLTAIDVDVYKHIITASSDGIINRYDQDSDTWAVYRNLRGEEIVDLFSTEDTLWVATNKGVAVYLINVDGLEFRDFYNNLPLTPGRAYCVTVFNNRIYYATENGILHAPSGFFVHNLKISDAWQLISVNDGLPSNDVRDLVPVEDTLLVATIEGAAYISSNNDVSVYENWTQGYVFKILVSAQDIYFIRDKDYFKLIGGYWSRVNWEGKSISSGTIDEQGEVWISFKHGGLKKRTWANPFLIDGPASNHIGVLLKANSGDLWISSGKFAVYNQEGFYKYNFEYWTNYKYYDNEWSRKNHAVYVYEELSGKILIGTWGGGITIVDDDLVDYYHSWPGDGRITVSTVDTVKEYSLPEVPAGKRSCFVPADVRADNYTVIPYMIEDNAGNLWCANLLASEPDYLAVIPRNDQGDLDFDCNNWFYFGNNIDMSKSESEISSMEFDNAGRLWMGTSSEGIRVFDFKGTIDYLGDDDKLKEYNISNAKIFSNRILCLKQDLDGIMWIGTAGGLSSYDGQSFWKHVGDIGPIENKINQIFVDDYNNKWFATDGGMTILKANESYWDPKAWVHYTPENSGLPSAIVNSIYVDQKRGEAYIGTESGLSIFLGSFSEIKDDLASVTGGPSPFILKNHSEYTIKNLVFNASVKILNINGRLIRLLTPENGGVEGGRAIWDGRDHSNNYVPSGIYIYLIYNEEGITDNGKIAVIKP